MMGRQVGEAQLFYIFSVDRHVPADHLLRRAAALSDGSAVALHDELAWGRLDCALRGTRPRGGLLITHFYRLEAKAMANELSGRKVAVLATDGVEQVELTEPVKALKQASAEVHVVAPKEGEIHGFNHHERGDLIPVDVPLQQADPNTYDALVLPGGVINPDQLRLLPEAIEFVRAFARAGKPIAAICHGPWTLIDAGAVQGRRLTSWPSLQNDLRNAGAEWVDAPVVTDQGLVTSRKPDDIPDFCRKMIEEFAEGRHQRAAE